MLLFRCFERNFWKSAFSLIWRSAIIQWNWLMEKFLGKSTELSIRFWFSFNFTWIKNYQSKSIKSIRIWTQFIIDLVHFFFFNSILFFAILLGLTFWLSCSSFWFSFGFPIRLRVFVSNNDSHDSTTNQIENIIKLLIEFSIIFQTNSNGIYEIRNQIYRIMVLWRSYRHRNQYTFVLIR